MIFDGVARWRINFIAFTGIFVEWVIVDGTFVAKENDVAELIGKQVYFGEILGKHSEIYGTVDAEDIEMISDDPVFVEQFAKIVGNVGYNPLEYLSEEDIEDNR
jgi:hypothetical protein